MLIEDMILLGACLIGTYLLYHCASNPAAAYNNRWRLAYLLPALFCLIHLIACDTEICLLGIYLGAVLLAAGFFVTKETFRKRAAILAAACMVITVIPCMVYGGYRCPDYVADFEEGFACMKEHYVLSEYKAIDWDTLYDKYLPEFEQAEKEHDEVANYMAWNAFCMEFHDGHVRFSPSAKEEPLMEKAGKKLAGNDYGLSMVTLDSGETVAVMVEEDSAVSKAGIHDGSVITSWDGQPIETVKEQVDMEMMPFPDIENEEFYRTVAAAGAGGDTITIAYLDDAGMEQSVVVDKMGNYYGRFKNTVERLLGSEVTQANLSWKKMDDDTACLTINNMVYDSWATETSNYSEMQQKLRLELGEMKQQGIKNLILDLRNNPGGSGQMSMAIASLFADGEQFWASDGTYNEETKTYEVVNSYNINGENLWEDGKIIVLVNASTNSAADHLAYGMGRLENVTVMGLTKSCGSAQAVHGVLLDSGELMFSENLLLDENREIWIDSDASRVTKTGVDVKVPMNQESVEAILIEDKDYVLEYALNYFTGRE